MGLKSIKYGNPSTKDILTYFIIKQKVPSVSLFYGPSGSGKSYFAHHFIQDLLCPNSIQGNACEECQSCKTVLANSSPDLLKIMSEDNTSIKIDDMRKAQEFSALQPVYSKQKVIWIEDAHLLTTEASNSILKILEEPNLTTLFLLTTSKLDSIIPTVKSRATPIPFSLFSQSDIKSILFETNPSEDFGQLISKISNGNVKKAISYLDSQNLEYRKLQIDYFLQLIQKSSMFAPYQSKEDILSFISTSQTLLHDMMQMKLFSGEASIVNDDYKEVLDQIVSKMDLKKITELLKTFIQAELDLNRVNINMKAYFEFLSFSLKKIVLFSN